MLVGIYVALELVGPPGRRVSCWPVHGISISSTRSVPARAEEFNGEADRGTVGRIHV